MRYFELNIRIKMIKLDSNSVAVDEVKDIAKAEKLLIKKKLYLKMNNVENKKFLDPNLKNKLKTVEENSII